MSWLRFDRDGRKWIHGYGLYCCDDTSLARPNYDEFVELLAMAFNEDSKVATTAMRTLLLSDDYAAWVREALSHHQPAVRDAAGRLVAAIDGRRPLKFNGDLIAWRELKAGAGSAPDPLPIPPKNRENRDAFIETCPLILDTHRAGVLATSRLVEEPILDRPGFLFVGTGKALSNRNATGPHYLVVNVDDGLDLIPKSTQQTLNRIGQEIDSDRVTALCSGGDYQLLAGILNLKSGEFVEQGKVPKENYFGSRLVIDPQTRMALISGMGETIDFQDKPHGIFTRWEITRPTMSAASGAVMVGDTPILYRCLFDKQWDGRHSEIMKFSNGELKQIGTRIAGHIYNLDWVTRDVLLVGTRNPPNLFFVNHETGQIAPPPFKLEQPQKAYRFWTDSVHDRHGRFWFFTTWGSTRTTREFSLNYWDGNTLKQYLRWSIPARRRVLNPHTGNMAITDEGRIWISIPERMLVVDTNTLDHRFFRVFEPPRSRHTVSERRLDDGQLRLQHHVVSLGIDVRQSWRVRLASSFRVAA